jgi:hypothetical protein
VARVSLGRSKATSSGPHIPLVLPASHASPVTSGTPSPFSLLERATADSTQFRRAKCAVSPSAMPSACDQVWSQGDFHRRTINRGNTCDIQHFRRFLPNGQSE